MYLILNFVPVKQSRDDISWYESSSTKDPGPPYKFQTRTQTGDPELFTYYKDTWNAANIFVLIHASLLEDYPPQFME